MRVRVREGEGEGEGQGLLHLLVEAWEYVHKQPQHLRLFGTCVQDKTRQGQDTTKTRQDKARQHNTTQDKARKDKDKTKTRQDKTRQDKTRQHRKDKTT